VLIHSLFHALSGLLGHGVDNLADWVGIRNIVHIFVSDGVQLIDFIEGLSATFVKVTWLGEELLTEFELFLESFALTLSLGVLFLDLNLPVLLFELLFLLQTVQLLSLFQEIILDTVLVGLNLKTEGINGLFDLEITSVNSLLFGLLQLLLLDLNSDLLLFNRLLLYLVLLFIRALQVDHLGVLPALVFSQLVRASLDFQLIVDVKLEQSGSFVVILKESAL